MTDDDMDMKLTASCYAGDIDGVREAIAGGADWPAGQEAALHTALQNWHVPLIRWLLTAPELPSRPSIHTGHDAVFRKACEMGDGELARWLAASPELSDHADVHACCDEAFELACRGGHTEIVRWLIAEHQTPASEHVHYLVANNPDIRDWLSGQALILPPRA